MEPTDIPVNPIDIQDISISDLTKKCMMFITALHPLELKNLLSVYFSRHIFSSEFLRKASDFASIEVESSSSSKQSGLLNVIRCSHLFSFFVIWELCPIPCMSSKSP